MKFTLMSFNHTTQTVHYKVIADRVWWDPFTWGYTPLFWGEMPLEDFFRILSKGNHKSVFVWWKG